MNGRTKKQAVRFFPASPIQLHFLTLTIKLKEDLSKYKSSFRTTTNHNLASEAWSMCLLCIRFNHSISLELELELGRWAADCLHQWSVDYWWLLLLLAALFVCSILCFMLKDWLTDWLWRTDCCLLLLSTLICIQSCAAIFIFSSPDLTLIELWIDRNTRAVCPENFE